MNSDLLLPLMLSKYAALTAAEISVKLLSHVVMRRIDAGKVILKKKSLVVEDE